MDRDALVQQVQLSILKRYDVLLDCNEFDDSTLRKLSKRLPKANGEHATFARWCDHVLGDYRPAVARYEYAVAGQTRIDTLRLGMREGLSNRESALTAEVEELKKQINALQAKQSALPPQVQPALDIEQVHWEHAWQYFYAGRRDVLRSLLADVRDIEGHIFDSQGERNRNYREVLDEGIRYMLEGLQRLGFIIDVTLTTAREHGFKPQYFDYHRTPDRDNRFDPLLSFKIREMPTDILVPLPEAVSDKSLCHIALYRGSAERATPEEVEHLGAFLHRMFAALAKSADHVPRAGLREHLLLALMLSWSAPGVSLDDMDSSSVYSHSDEAWVTQYAQPADQRVEMSPLTVFKLLANAVAAHSNN
ncbi:hypothetical protein ACNFBR_09680 [Pseudomonas sp. NY11955]|uniref:hypothetical protein n=1 Tax=Pseudomonas sp. NY11955 TaxID=3400363 RepID=UPI003A8861D8